jgi:rhamnulokinase
VTTVGSHDTASAVVAVPATDASSAYIISGTWSLVGLDLPQPVITEAARTHNFTNERGVDGRTRFLRNVGGLWLLQESMRAWAAEGRAIALDDLLAEAAAQPAGGPTVDVDAPAFIPPGSMPQRIASAVVATGAPPPETPAEVARCVIESLARSYANTVEQAARLADQRVSVVHVVGGGSQNQLLCQRTADLTGRPVTAGPVEATALGNILVQARAHGAAPSDLSTLRATVAHGADTRRFSPRPDVGSRS